jgi:diphthine-ammonia ligase
VPPFFAAEVESLPRQAEVEWHAHVGIAGACEGSIEMFSLDASAGGKCNAWSMLVRENDSIFLHTTVAYNAPEVEVADATLTHLQAVYEESAQKLKLSLQSTASQMPYLVYLDAKVSETGDLLSSDRTAATTVVPCHSLWAADGSRRSALALYRRMLSNGC